MTNDRNPYTGQRHDSRTMQEFCSDLTSDVAQLEDTRPDEYAELMRVFTISIPLASLVARGIISDELSDEATDYVRALDTELTRIYVSKG